MKKPIFKRAIAFILAALMVLGTVAYLFTIVAYGVETTRVPGFIISYSINGKDTIAVNDQITFKMTFEPEKQSGIPDLKGATVEIDKNKSGFEAPATFNAIIPEKDGSGNYVFQLENLSYKPGNDATKKGKLAFKIKKADDGSDLFANSIVINVTECETTPSSSGSSTPDDPNSGNSGGDDDNNTPTPSLTTNMIYTIQKIRRSSNSTTFEIGSDTKNDPTINRGDYVDVLVQFSIPGAEKEDIIKNSVPQVKVLVDRGSFQFQNSNNSSIYIKRVEPVQGGVTCYVELTMLRYIGTGDTLAFTVQSKTSNEETPYIYEQFATEVTTCVPYVPKETTPEPDDPDPAPMEMATPYVIISNYNYGGTITAGDTFPLSITLFNTSKNIDVENMMVTITMPEAFMLTSSSNTFYIEELHNEESVTKTVDVTAKANAAPQSHNIDISMKYQYVDEKLNSRRDNTTQETISIPVVQVDRFQLTGVDVPMEIYMGEEGFLSVNFVNKGRSEVYNLSAEISGDIQNPGQQQNLGNLASGATGTADFYITPNAEGVCTGEVTITYEDTNMEEKIATIQWSTNVVDPFAGMDFGGDFGEFDYGMIEDPSLMEGEQKSSLPFIAGGVGVAAVIAAVIIRKRIQRKKREAEDADL